MLPGEVRALYAAFDRFPSPKGAATHIGAWLPQLATSFGTTTLVALGDPSMPAYQHDGAVEILRDRRPAPDPLTRAARFGQVVAAAAAERPDLRLVHARDPWGAASLLEVAAVRSGRVPLVLEVNGLPSIELPYAWPDLTPATLDKITALEQRCLARARVVVTPSAVLAQLLRARGVPDERVVVIPNGADLVASAPPPPEAPDRYLVYVGAIQPWQGLGILLAAIRRLRDLDLDLVVCAAVPEKRTRRLRDQARRLGVADRVHWHHGLGRSEVAGWLGGALASVAPLRNCDRNVIQGCCPLKVLESMAAGTPVIASDLPAVRELVADGVHGRLVPPDRPDALARAVRVLVDHPETARAWGEAGRERIARELTWDHSRRRLAAVYTEAVGTSG